MGSFFSKSSTSITSSTAASTSQPSPSHSKVVAIEENAISKSKQKPVTRFNLQLAQMVNKVKNKLESLPNDSAELDAMRNEAIDKFGELVLPDVLVKNKFGLYDSALKKQRVDIIINLLTVLSNLNIIFLKLFLNSKELDDFIQNGQVIHPRMSSPVSPNGTYIKNYFTIVASIIGLSFEQMISDTNETRKQPSNSKRFYELDNNEIQRIIVKYINLSAVPIGSIDNLEGLYYTIEKSRLTYSENHYEARETFAKEFNFDNVKDWVATEKYGPLAATKFYRKHSRQLKSSSRNRTRKN
jgi:hypothetical protein